MAEISVDTMAKVPALVARLYVGSVIDEAERQAVFEIKQVFAKMRATYLADLKGEEPMKLLLATADLWRFQQAVSATPGDTAGGEG